MSFEAVSNIAQAEAQAKVTVAEAESKAKQMLADADTAEPERRVILIITAMPMTSNEHSSIKQTKRYLPFTTSRFAKGSSAEKRMSLASRAL